MNGFMGTRGSLMLDVVFLAMLAVVPVMWFGVARARLRGSYRQHNRIQICLASVLLLTVAIFELEIRLSGWR